MRSDRRDRRSSDRNDRSPKAKAEAEALPRGACVVCGLADARQLATVALRGGEAVTVCGSHALLHGRILDGRTAGPFETVAELRSALADRRSSTRRAAGRTGEGDELAERLTAAFRRERRAGERRAG